MSSESSRPEVAYYYPAPYWDAYESGSIKSLLLFFDEVAILLPGYMDGRHRMADPSLVEPLEDRGLLKDLDPQTFIDEEVTESLAEVLVALLASGVFDDLPLDVQFHELSYSRMGYGADVELAAWVVQKLEAKGLAQPSNDGVSVPLQPTVRTAILVLLAQLARGAGRRSGIDLHPATTHQRAVADLIRTLALAPLPSAGHVLQLDLEQVTLNLDPVPLDDVLGFRAEHASEHRAYRHDLRRVLADLAPLDPNEREAMLWARREELAEAAHELQRTARRAFKVALAGWSLALAGAAWDVIGGDPIGLILGAAGGALGLTEGNDSGAGAYSYLFASHDALR